MTIEKLKDQISEDVEVTAMKCIDERYIYRHSIVQDIVWWNI